jgi:hypothetical protein
VINSLNRPATIANRIPVATSLPSYTFGILVSSSFYKCNM